MISAKSHMLKTRPLLRHMYEKPMHSVEFARNCASRAHAQESPRIARFTMILHNFMDFPELWQFQKASRGFEPRSLDSESRVLAVTPRGQVNID